ncbi:MAG: hypothetical protein GF320_00520, partial [Armatimonadia bacterium]|nr:hypothetical protein [Armatimonadia bacterium]
MFPHTLTSCGLALLGLVTAVSAQPGDPAARAIVPDMKKAEPSDWTEEYLDLILAVRVVENMGQAVDHIN